MRFLFSRGVCRTAGLSLLTLLAASAAQAQSLALSSGDSATVSNAGTIGVIGGKSFSNNVSSYGVFFGSNVQTSGTAVFNLTGGSLFAASGTVTDIVAGGSGPVTISGGSVGVSHGALGVDAAGSGPVLISGGTFRGDQLSSTLYVENAAAVQITGGDFSQTQAPFSIGAGGNLFLFSKNDTPFTFTGIPGTPFSGVSYNNTSLSLASIPSNFFSSYGVSGTLADGESFSATLRGLGTVNFNLPAPAAVPEASTTLSFGLLLMLGLGGLAVAKHRKAAA